LIESIQASYAASEGAPPAEYCEQSRPGMLYATLCCLCLCFAVEPDRGRHRLHPRDQGSILALSVLEQAADLLDGARGGGRHVEARVRGEAVPAGTTGRSSACGRGSGRDGECHRYRDCGA